MKQNRLHTFAEATSNWTGTLHVIWMLRAKSGIFPFRAFAVYIDALRTFERGKNLELQAKAMQHDIE